VATSDEPEALVALGVLISPHGVRGGLRAKLYNPDSELLFERPKVWLRGAGLLEERALRHVQAHGAGLMLELAGCASRDAAEALRGVELCVPRSALPPLPPDEHYFVDLIGLQAVDPSGKELGPVVDVHQYPASQVLCLDLPEGRFEVPLRAPYLVEVQLADKRVVVDGLADLEPVPPRGAKKREKR
jgi:16S rRNA processing protein RimM